MAMMITFILAILALSSLMARAQDILRHRKERYIIPELNTKTAKLKLEEERRLRHEVALYWTRILQVSAPLPLSLDVASLDVMTLEPLSISTIEPFSIATIDPFGGTPTESPTKSPTETPTKTPSESPSKKPTMLPSAPPTAEPTVGGIVELDIDDDFKVECSGKAGKMGGKTGGKMTVVSPPPIECAGKQGGKMGGKMNIESSGLSGGKMGKMSRASGKMSGGKMGPTTSSDGSDEIGFGNFEEETSATMSPIGGKMYGGKMYGGKMHGGKMYGGKMSFPSPTISPSANGILALDDESKSSGKNGGKMMRALR